MRLLGCKLVTLVLIAVMAMPAVSPPALRHSHAGGDTSHKHEVATDEPHGHSHAHGPRPSSRHSHQTAPTTAKHSHDHQAAHSATSPAEHVHVFWFGFEFSMPMPAPVRSDSPRPIVGVDQWVPLIWEFTLPEAAADGSRIRATDLAMPTVQEPLLAVRSVVPPLQQTAATWLCDTARRERSGVLVI